MKDAPFVLDANVFIEAARRYYAFDIAPGFWAALAAQANAGTIVSISNVREELEKQDDTLAAWAKSDFAQAFMTTRDGDVVLAYKKVMDWVQSQPQYTDDAKADFAAGADGWIVAYAIAKGGTVVTQEVLRPDKKTRVPIPNVCRHFGVPFIGTFEMIHILGMKLK